MKISVIIPFLSENKEKIKIHCAIGRVNKFDPLFEFSKGKFKEWQESQNNKNFEREYILSLIYKQKGEWLFAGIYRSISLVEEKGGRYTYKTELLDNGKDLIGRLIIKFDKDFRASYLLFEKFNDELEICEVLRKQYKIDPFPGFNSVHITFDLLKEIVNEEESSWKSSLSNVKGIYLISDKKNGKLYVGSAYGENAFWQRWKNYVENGHGGNKKLKEIIDKNSYEYSSNFTFSVLEICNLNTMDDEIINKESFWKERLLTREFGYNEN
jgi:hypothetical protein